MPITCMEILGPTCPGISGSSPSSSATWPPGTPRSGPSLAASSTCGELKKRDVERRLVALRGSQPRNLIGAEHDRLGDRGPGAPREGREQDSCGAPRSRCREMSRPPAFSTCARRIAGNERGGAECSPALRRSRSMRSSGCHVLTHPSGVGRTLERHCRQRARSARRALARRSAADGWIWPSRGSLILSDTPAAISTS